MTLSRIRLPADFAFDRVVRSHGWYNLLPFGYDETRGELSTRALSSLGAVTLSFRARDGVLEARGDLPARELRAMASRMFSLDLDLSGFDAALAAEPELRRALRRGAG